MGDKALPGGTIKERIGRGDLVAGAWINFPSPDLVELAGRLGFDFVFVDGEHGLVGHTECLDLVRAADAAGVVPFVRVPRNEAPTILGYLETGVQGIVVPHVRTPDEARAVVGAVKFPPLGRRSVMYSSRAGQYGAGVGGAAYCEEANARTIVVALVEDLEGVRNLEAIAAVPGVDLLFLGDGDLALDMGYAGQSRHPAVQAVVADALRRARAAGIRVGMCAFSPDAVEPLVASGVCWTMTTATTLFSTAARAYLAAIRDAASREAAPEPPTTAT